MRNAPTVSSRPAQIRETSDLLIPTALRVPRPGRRPNESTRPARRPPSPPRRGPGRSVDAARGSTGRSCPCAAWGCATRRHRPAWSTGGAVTRCVRSPVRRCVRNGRRRSARRLRPRSAPAAPAARRHGSDRHPRRRGTPPTSPTGQTETGPSVRYSFVCSCRNTPRITPMASPVVDPRRTSQSPPFGGTPTPSHRRGAFLGRTLAEAAAESIYRLFGHQGPQAAPVWQRRSVVSAFISLERRLRLSLIGKDLPTVDPGELRSAFGEGPERQSRSTLADRRKELHGGRPPPARRLDHEIDPAAFVAVFEARSSAGSADTPFSGPASAASSADGTPRTTRS